MLGPSEVGGIVIIIGAAAAGFAKIVRALKEIHILVNNRFTAVLRLLVISTKKEYDRSHSPEDLVVYNDALTALREAEAAALVVSGGNS